MKRPQSALVIGAGVIGMATAYALARKGLSVTLVDQGQEPGMGTSFGNGAQLSYCYTDALASPSLLSSLPRLSLGLDPSFRFRMRWDSDYICWLVGFLRNCTHGKFYTNTIAALKLAQQSREAMAALQKAHDIDFGHRVAGKMHLYANNTQFQKARSLSEQKREFGVNQQALSAAEAKQLEPALNMTSGPLSGVIYSPDDAVGNPHIFCKEVHAVLVKSYGMKSYLGTGISSIKLKQEAQVKCSNGEVITADIAILCTGSAAPDLLSPLRIKIPVQPMKGYSFEIPSGNSSPKTSITDSSRRIVFTNLGDTIRIAGLAEMGNGSSRIDQNSIEKLISTAQQSMPNAGNYGMAKNFWAGLRPMTPNSQPIISRPHNHFAINTGHGMLGWTMAMGSGERLASLV